MKIDGGIILTSRETNGTIETLPAGESMKIQSKPIIGLGRCIITVTIEQKTFGLSESHYSEATVLLVFTRVKRA
jgi:hypothetical protein